MTTMTEIITWTVEMAVNVTEPDSDDVVTVAYAGVDEMLEFLAHSGMSPVVKVTKKTTTWNPASETVESWNVDLQDNSVWQE